MNYMDLLFYPADKEEKMEKTSGHTIVLPGNPASWIKDICYSYKADNSMEIQYYDGIAKADCRMQIVRNGILELQDISFDKSQEESWAASSISGQYVLISVQRSEDGKNVLASWEYDNCEFAIQATVSGKDADIISIPKTAIYIINNLD